VGEGHVIRLGPRFRLGFRFGIWFYWWKKSM